MNSRGVYISIVLTVVILVVTTTVFGLTYTVNPEGTGDYPDIQTAIDAVMSGDVIELTDGVFTGDGNRDIDFLGKAIMIRAANWHPEECIIDCEGSEEYPHRGFLFISGETDATILAGITIRNGFAPVDDFLGGAIKLGESVYPQISNCRFLNNSAVAGGAIMGEWFCHPRIQGCLFEENEAQVGSALAFRNPSTVTLGDCEIMRNNAVWGGAVVYGGWRESTDLNGYVQVVPDLNSSSVIEDSELFSTAPATSRLTIKDCTFQENRITSDLIGGGLYFAGTESSWLELNSSLFCGNGGGPGSRAGAVYFSGYENYPSWVMFSTFARNEAGAEGTEGSCIRHAGGDLLIDACILAMNEGTPVVCEGSGHIDVTCSDIQGNTGGDWTGCIEPLLGIQGNFSKDPLFCDPYHWFFRLASDSPCLPAHNECGYQIGGMAEACDVPAAVMGQWNPVNGSRIAPICPNPFHPTAKIRFYLPTEQLMNLSIYNVMGRQLRVLSEGVLSAGEHELVWDGRDTGGDDMPSGVYFCRLKTATSFDQKKIILIR